MSKIKKKMSKLLTSSKGGIFRMTLNRAKVGNCIDPETYHLLLAAVKEAAADPNVKFAVLAGTGKFFSTGADVQQVLDGVDDPSRGPPHVVETIRNSAVALTQALIDFPKPLVAAVNGPAVGWSAAALGLFDIVYMSQSATINTPFMVLGLVPEGLSSVTFPARMGRSLATEVLLLGRKVTSTELAAAGFASRVFPDEGFDEKVNEVLEKAVSQASLPSILGGKRLLINAELRATLTAANKAEMAGLKEQFEEGEPIRRFKALAAQLAAKKK